MTRPLQILLVFILSWVSTGGGHLHNQLGDGHDQPFMPGCPRKCGSVSIPYPFGMGRPNCYFTNEFLINCSGGFRPKPLFMGMEVTQIQLDPTQVHLRSMHMRPMVMYWAVGNQSCGVARRNANRYICAARADCTDTTDNSGYRCRCSHGYKGNPFLTDGCKDVDECRDRSLNKCGHDGCVNTEGSYRCLCPRLHHFEYSTGRCVPDPLLEALVYVGVGMGITSVFAGVFCSYIGWKKIKLGKLRKRFFLRNGGLLLEQKLSRSTGAPDAAQIFSAEELMKATDGFDDRRIIGRGGYSTVYKGIMPHTNRVVAVKKSNTIDRGRIEQFVNEVVVLSRIHHRNVVRLLGCCLETEVPLLVYEYVGNGTLFDHLHRTGGRTGALPWGARLRIAAESAGVLSYLHSACSTPIIHRDIKSTNILLDYGGRAKVSDFGASKLVPMDESQVWTLVQGTLGYLDPEYMQTNQLTEKSDVYSFGVLLVELLTGKKALCFDRPEEERSLASHFLVSVKEERISEVLDGGVTGEWGMEDVDGVMRVAMRCLRLKGEERPTMKEVSTELERVMERSSWAVNPVRGTPLETGRFGGATGGGGSVGFFSGEMEVQLEAGR